MSVGLYAALLLGVLLVGLAVTLLTGEPLAGILIVGPGTVLLLLTRARS